ncbi:MAG: PAS domain S-box protein [Bacteroidetes bacterium]|nr:PAS domain S-box protein [Bacteroidota bacterium]
MNHSKEQLIAENNRLKAKVSELEKSNIEQKKTIDKLSETNSEFNLLNHRLILAAKSVEVGIFDLNLDTKSLTWNDEMYKLFGITRKDFDGKLDDWLKYIHQKDVDKFRNILIPTDKKNNIFSTEYRIIQANGTLRYLNITAQFTYDKNQNPINIIGVNTDITKRKKAEAKLHQQKKFLQHIIDCLSHPFLIVNADDYTIQMANFAAGNDIEMNKTKCFEISHSSNLACNQIKESCTLEIVKNTKKSTIVEHIHYDKYGAKRLSEIHAYPLFDENGKLAQIIKYCIDITERKEIESALYNSEKKYRNIVENAQDIIWQINLKGELVFLNKYAEKIAGEKSDSLKGKHYSELIDPSDIDRINRIHIAVIQGETVEYKLCTYPKKGKVVYLEIKATPISSNGKIVGTLNFGRNISERKKAEETIERNLKYQKLISTISTKFVRNNNLDQSINHLLKHIGEYSKASRAYVFLLSENRKIISNTHEWCADGVSPQIDYLQGLLVNDFNWTMKKLYRNETIHVEDVLKLPEDANQERESFIAQGIKSLVILPLNIFGNLLGFIGFDNVEATEAWPKETINILQISSEILTNTIHSKNAENEIRTKHEKFKSIFEYAPVGILIIDVEGNPKEINKSVLNILGSPSTEQTRNLNIHKLDRLKKTGFTADFRTCISSVKIVRNENEYITFWGKKLFIRYTLTPIIDNEKRIKEVQCFFEDLTEQKYAEIQLKKNKDKLQKLNFDLIEKINQEVEKSREKDRMMVVQSKQAAMGEMIGNIAHQWRQPLNDIGLYIQNLQDGFEFEEITVETLNEIVEKTMKKLDYMSQTIDDFRNFFHSDKEKTNFSLTRNIFKTLTMTEATFKNNSIELKKDLEEDLLFLGFPNEFSQAILNILNNAKDVLIERKIENPIIEIKLYKQAKKSVLKIYNNGGEIPDNIIDKIFDPYFTTKGELTGTGLGLYISKTIIERNMQGKLSVSNTKGGVEFMIEL